MHGIRMMNSFQTTLTPNPDKLYKSNVTLQRNKQKSAFERALPMLASSGAGGLANVQMSI